MLTALLLWVLAFSDVTGCTVQGYLYRMGDEASFTPANACQGIQAQTEGTTLVLSSPHVWVAIDVPPTRGHVRFAYAWQRERAFIDGEPVPIRWGRVLTG